MRVWSFSLKVECVALKSGICSGSAQMHVFAARGVTCCLEDPSVCVYLGENFPVVATSAGSAGPQRRDPENTSHSTDEGCSPRWLKHVRF